MVGELSRYKRICSPAQLLSLSQLKGRIAWWIQQFAFDITHRPGEKLTGANALLWLDISQTRKMIWTIAYHVQLWGGKYKGIFNFTVIGSMFQEAVQPRLWTCATTVLTLEDTAFFGRLAESWLDNLHGKTQKKGCLHRYAIPVSLTRSSLGLKDTLWSSTPHLSFCGAVTDMQVG